ncbi:MAG: SoxR reducing system RseC family protein [Halioglobus sp.]|nr:SoxR reducing system RseC family protein [Halioglobus sp.]
MLTESGRVVGLESDGLWVETIRRSTCGTCSAQKGCGHGLLNRIAEGKRGYIRVLPGEHPVSHYKIDDQVLISIPEEVILRGSIIAYVLPLLTMLAGALMAVNWLPGSEDLLAVCGAAGGLVLGYALVRWHGIRHRRDPDFQPVLLRVIAAPTDAVTLR